MLNDYVLKFRCQSCKKQSKLKLSRPSRMDLENDLGTIFYAPCEHCAIRKEYHVNDIKAEINTNFGFLAILVVFSLIALATLLLLNIGFISLATLVLPIAIYSIYTHNLNQTISTFNRDIIPRDRNYQPKNKKSI